MVQTAWSHLNHSYLYPKVLSIDAEHLVIASILSACRGDSLISFEDMSRRLERLVGSALFEEGLLADEWLTRELSR